MPMPINDKIESKQLKKQRKQTEGIKACKKHIWTRVLETTREQDPAHLLTLQTVVVRSKISRLVLANTDWWCHLVGIILTATS